MPSTFFRGGTIWTGVNGETTDALLVVDGTVQALGEAAHAQAEGAEDVDLGGGFLMPSFGDGHAHPLPGGLEAVGPKVRPCKSVDEILAEVKRFAAEHPDDEWIVGASYESSMAPGGLFDARWLDAAVPDRPVVLRAWDYHTVWCNSAALERAGISADTPDPVLGEIPRRDDGSPLGMLREWGAVDLVQKVVPERDPAVRIGALRMAAEYYLSHGVTWTHAANTAETMSRSSPASTTNSPRLSGLGWPRSKRRGLSQPAPATAGPSCRVGQGRQPPSGGLC